MEIYIVAKLPPAFQRKLGFVRILGAYMDQDNAQSAFDEQNAKDGDALFYTAQLQPSKKQNVFSENPGFPQKTITKAEAIRLSEIMRVDRPISITSPTVIGGKSK